MPAGTRVDAFEGAIRTVCEPQFDRPLNDISLGQVLMRLFQTSRRFNYEVQPQLGMLQKTLLNIEGLGRQLYPQLDLWTTAKPFLEKWMAEQVGWRGLARNLEREAPQWANLLPQLPRLAHRLLAANPTAGIEARLDAILAADRRRNHLLAALTLVGAGMLATLLYVLFAS